MQPQRLDLIVFDFDGTLCDSADVKTEAFYELYLDEYGSGFASTVRDYHLANTGLSRYDKIRHIERRLLGREPDEQRVEELAVRFSELVEQAVVDAPLFDGVYEFLSLRPTGTVVAVASATPTDELLRIVDRKGLSGFFDAVEGSPRSKTEIITGYLTAFNVEPRRAVMVGDQPSDLAGAHGTGVQALMIASDDTSWTGDAARVDDFRRASAWLTDRITIEASTEQ